MHMREVTIAYGMTETSPVSFQSATDRPARARVTTVGRIQPHLEVKVVDAAGTRRAGRRDGRAVHARLLGDARLLGRRGKHARGDRPTAGCTPATWRRIDAEGYCNIVGRVKDMLIRGGENVYPREIEEFLFRHPKVQYGAGVRRAGPEVRRGGLRLDRAASRASRPPRRRSATSAAARSRTTRCRATSASSTSCR